MTDLPIDAEYYVKELYAPAGFVNAEEVQEFTVSYAGENEDSVVVDLIFEDEAFLVGRLFCVASCYRLCRDG